MIQLLSQERKTLAELTEIHHPLFFRQSFAAQGYPHTKRMAMQISIFAAICLFWIVERMRRLEIELAINLETRHGYLTPIILCICVDSRHLGWAMQ